MRLLVRAAIIPPAFAVAHSLVAHSLVAHSLAEARLRALPSAPKTRNTPA